MRDGLADHLNRILRMEQSMKAVNESPGVTGSPRESLPNISISSHWRGEWSETRKRSRTGFGEIGPPSQCLRTLPFILPYNAHPPTKPRRRPPRNGKGRTGLIHGFAPLLNFNYRRQPHAEDSADRISGQRAGNEVHLRWYRHRHLHRRSKGGYYRSTELAIVVPRQS